MRDIAVRAATTALANAIRAENHDAVSSMATTSAAIERWSPTAPEPVTVYPDPVVPRPTRWRWGVMEWAMLTGTLAVTAAAILAVMSITRALIDAIGLTGHALATAIPGALGLGGLVILGLIVLAFSRGSGGTFSGTFSGIWK